ncbi:MAG TPA: long-chain fatty acid--CoA ligase [Verrucomicrobiota bacterium]|nr:long-chain fatty acid--CoA ligase [Verrucomicrobiota bacterium]
MNLAQAFADSARKRPDKTALYWGESEFTYASLLARSEAVTRQLTQSFGVKPGDRVAIWLKNCPEFVPALFGILGAGAVVVPINNFLKPQEVSYILADADANLLISDVELSAHFPALTAERPELKFLKVEEFQPADGDRQSAIGNRQSTESDLAVLIYTSGTTGRPKGAMLSHGNLLHNVESCRIVLETVDQDRMAVLLPMFHSYMLTVGILLPLIVGGSLVLARSLHQPRQILQEFCERRATILPAIPQFYRTLASAPAAMPLPFRICISGAAPLPAQVLKDFEEKFKIPLIEGYGLSEASPVVSKNPLRGVRKVGSIGLPIPNVEVSVQDESGRILGPKEIGEICVRGGNVMQGYWKNPQATAEVMRGGWLLTGDIGYRDEDGYFYITDRKKDMLLVNGINVYPREIEEVLYQFPGVKEVAVIGVPDVRKGEQPVAYVAFNDGVTADERTLQQFLKPRLADYKIPRHIITMPALPRNATGKILKTALRELSAKSGQDQGQ